MTALHYAVEREGEGIVEVLLQYNPPVNAQNNAGWTALHAAVSGSKAGITKRLLDIAADLYIEDAWRRTAWFVAQEAGNVAMIQLFIGQMSSSVYNRRVNIQTPIDLT